MALMTPFVDLYRIASGAPRNDVDEGTARRAGKGLRQGWRAWIRYRRLARMSDEALAREGLTRETIGRHAFFGDDRRS